MKHSLLFSILLLFVAVSCAENAADAQHEKVPERCGWNEYMPKLRGEVDSVAMVVTEPEYDVTCKYSYKFNSRGDVEEWNSLYSNEEPCDKRVYKYDSEGRNTELAWFRSEGPFWQTLRYTYDEKGKVVESRESAEGMELNRVLYKHDEQGRLIEVTFEDGGECYGRYCYQYDNKGRKLNKVSYTSSGVLNGQERFFYDENGNDAGYDLYDENGEVQSSVRYSYDSKGNKIEGKGDSWHHQYQHTYDAQDNVVESKEYDVKTNTLRRIVEFKIYYRQK